MWQENRKENLELNNKKRNRNRISSVKFHKAKKNNENEPIFDRDGKENSNKINISSLIISELPILTLNSKNELSKKNIIKDNDEKLFKLDFNGNKDSKNSILNITNIKSTKIPSKSKRKRHTNSKEINNILIDNKKTKSSIQDTNSNVNNKNNKIKIIQKNISLSVKHKKIQNEQKLSTDIIVDTKDKEKIKSTINSPKSKRKKYKPNNNSNIPLVNNNESKITSDKGSETKNPIKKQKQKSKNNSRIKVIEKEKIKFIPVVNKNVKVENLIQTKIKKINTNNIMNKSVEQNLIDTNNNQNGISKEKTIDKINKKQKNKINALKVKKDIQPVEKVHILDADITSSKKQKRNKKTNANLLNNDSITQLDFTVLSNNLVNENSSKKLKKEDTKNELVSENKTKDKLIKKNVNLNLSKRQIISIDLEKIKTNYGIKITTQDKALYNKIRTIVYAIGFEKLNDNFLFLLKKDPTLSIEDIYEIYKFEETIRINFLTKILKIENIFNNALINYTDLKKKNKLDFGKKIMKFKEQEEKAKKKIISFINVELDERTFKDALYLAKEVRNRISHNDFLIKFLYQNDDYKLGNIIESLNSISGEEKNFKDIVDKIINEKIQKLLDYKV